MKKKYLLVSLFCFLLLSAYAQHDIWKVGTALTLPKGFYDVSVFEPTYMGVTPRLEISAQPWLFPVMPNFKIKRNWKKTDIYIATRHGIYYPSLALAIGKQLGIDSTLTNTPKIPQMVCMEHEILFSTWLIKPTNCHKGDALLTLKIGLQTAFNSIENTMTYVYRPEIFPHGGVFADKLMWFVGLDLDGHYGTTMNYCIDFEFSKIVDSENKLYEISHKGMFIMPLRTKKHRLVFGYKVFYDKYVNSSKFSFVPMVDFTWNLRKRTRTVPDGEIGDLYGF